MLNETKDCIRIGCKQRRRKYAGRSGDCAGAYMCRTNERVARWTGAHKERRKKKKEKLSRSKQSNAAFLRDSKKGSDNDNLMLVVLEYTL